MTKNDLIKKVQQSFPYYPARDLGKAVNTIFTAMTHALVNCQRIEIRGWGILSVKSRLARQGHNPKNGQVFYVPTRKVPCFKVSRELQRRIND